MNYEQKALEWIAKGDKAMKKSFMSKPEPEIAADYYEKAANMYKLGKKWDLAGEIFEKSALCYISSKNNISSARQYQSASLAYKLGNNFEKSIEALKLASNIYVEESQMSLAGKSMRDLSELQENSADLEGALESLTSAIEYLESANEPLTASGLKPRAAVLAAESGQFQLAANLYEESASKATISQSVIDFYFRAILCHLRSGDTVEASKSLERIGGKSSEFALSAEFIFIDSVIKAIDSMDQQAFEESVNLFKKNSRNRLDSWKTKILIQIKSTIPNEEEAAIL